MRIVYVLTVTAPSIAGVCEVLSNQNVGKAILSVNWLQCVTITKLDPHILLNSFSEICFELFVFLLFLISLEIGSRLSRVFSILAGWDTVFFFVGTCGLCLLF